MTHFGGYLDLGGGSGTRRYGEVDDESVLNIGLVPKLRGAEGILGYVAKDGVGSIENVDVAPVGG